jgi:hypothetical protein
VVRCPDKIIDISDAEIFEGSIVLAGIEKKEGDCLRVPDLEGLEGLLRIIGRENHPIRVIIKGDADQDHESDYEKDNGFFFREWE